MKPKFIFFSIALVFITTNMLLSQGLITKIPNQVFIGARPMAMSETFVAVADDINAIYWNPAGLPALNQLGVNSMHTNLYQSSVGLNYLSLAFPGPYNTGIGVDWMNIGFDDNELEFGKNKFNFSAGYKPVEWMSLGFSLKYLRMNASLDQMSQGTFYGWGADVGFLFHTYPKLKLGLVIHDFTNTKMKGIEDPVYRRNIRVGAAYKLFDNLLIATDVDDRFHIGSEWWLFKKLLALRAGLQQDFYTDERVTFSCGIGLDIPLWGQSIRFDYAFTDTPTLPNTHRTSLSFLIDLFPQLVKIKDVKIEPVYASLYKYHSKNPIGQLYVDYEGDEDLDCTVTVKANKYTEEQTKNIVIHAKSVDENIQSISINTVFTDSILYEPDNIPLIADIKISYMSGNRQKEEHDSGEFHLFRRNSINWQEGVEQAAAFITPNDSSIKKFARMALLDDAELDEPIRIKNEQFTKSVRLFNAVSKYGICYEEDSITPYSRTYKAFDNIYYPAQLLKEKRGDCDDLVVLMASLFENKNIPTALVSVPGHIFLLFNTGIHMTRYFELCCANQQFYVQDNQVWIPLETTWVGRSFCEAWEQGAELLNQYSEDYKQIIYVHDAWELYEPLAYTGKIVKSYWDFQQYNFAQENKKIRSAEVQYLSGLEKKLAQYPDSSQLRNQLAITYAYQNNIKKAEHHFQRLLASDSSNFFALNNLGNLFFMKGNLDSAETYYLEALKFTESKEDSDGINLNLGLAYAAADSEHLAVDMFAQVMRDSTDYQRIGDLLGIIVHEGELAKNAKLIPKKKICTITVKQIIGKAKKKKKPSREPRRKIKKKKQITTKGRQPKDQIENVFFWAF